MSAPSHSNGHAAAGRHHQGHAAAAGRHHHGHATAAGGQAGGHHHGHDHHGHHPRISRKDYNTGFILAVILTIIPFGLVMSGAFEDTATTSMIVMGLGAVQIVVHMVYFLHMNRQSEGGWTFLAFVFTVILVVITLVGSLWVMYHLNNNLMPATNHNLRIVP